MRPRGDRVHTSAGVATGPVGFLRVYDTAFGEVAQGGCLLPETLVFTSDGLLRLDEIADSQKPGWQTHTLQVATDQGWRSSPRAFNNGIAPILRVHTREGLSIAGTPEHRVKVMTADGPLWRTLDELEAGDWIIVQLGQHAGQLQALRQPQRAHGNQVMPHFPSVLDNDLAFFMGYLVGDGFVATQEDDHRVGVSVSHASYLMHEMPLLLERLFGVTIHTQQKPDDRSVTLVIDNRAVKEFLRLNGLTKLRSREASVPLLIRQSPPEIVGEFLRGLFEADGSLSSGFPNLTTASPRLVEETATLLIGLGVPARIRSVSPGVAHFGKNTIYHVRVSSTAGLNAWREKIGCDPRSRFAVSMAWESDLRRESSYTLPHARYWLQPVLDAITLEQVDARGRGMGINFRSSAPKLRRALLRYLRNDREFTQSACSELARRYPEFAEHVVPLNDQWYVQVAGVEAQSDALTLDLEVNDNHTYLAQGMVTHNTRRGANMAVLRVDHPDILDFIHCKTSEGAISNFNISVGITDAFMTAVRNDEDFDLVNPRDGKVWKTVRARELFDEIVKYAHHNGEPGVLFLDAANRENPVPHLYELEATNPCHRGTNLVHTDLGRVPIKDLVGQNFNVVAPTGEFVRAIAYPTGNKPLFRVHFDNGTTIDLTENHNLVMAGGSKKQVRDLLPGDPIQTAPRAIGLVKPVGFANISVKQMVHPSGVNQDKRDFDLNATTVTRVEDLGIVEPVFNLTVDHPMHQFAVNGIISANCGEQWLGEYENCCLGSINLAQHLTSDGKLDWAKLRESIETSTRFLDDVVDANKYVPAVPELTQAAHRARRIGLGIMGLGDAMYALGIRYGSRAGEEFSAQVMEFVRYYAMQTSIELARTRGAFPAIKGSLYDPEHLQWTPPRPIEPYTHTWDRPALDWNAIVVGVKKYGVRNAAQTTIAPTGTIATVAGVESYGCEPVFALAYMRHVNDQGKDLQLDYISPAFERALIDARVDEATRQKIFERVRLTGTCQDVDLVPQKIRDTFVVASDITPEEHVRMQAAMQAFVDNSLSKTVNFPATATTDDVAHAYFTAWELGCKGITVYVAGSREQVVLETKETALKKSKSEPVPEYVVAQKKPREHALVGQTYKIETPLGGAYVTVNRNGNDEPFEVFCNVGKAGSDTAAVSEAIGRLVSLALRLPSPLTPTERLEEIVKQLSGIGGGRPMGFGLQRVRSLPDGIAQVLNEELGKPRVAENEPADTQQLQLFKVGDLCPACGHATFVNEEGCRKCYSCGHSEC
ncbi:MAG: hypothetical protein HZC40_21840 [Chloroflexi bacterium]|nr:hypothetical protein [Chloroflexota bacterium]